MITKEEYNNAINELIKMGIKNKYGLSYFENEEDIKRASELKSIMYQYEKENKANEPSKVKTKRLSNR